MPIHIAPVLRFLEAAEEANGLIVPLDSAMMTVVKGQEAAGLQAKPTLVGASSVRIIRGQQHTASGTGSSLLMEEAEPAAHTAVEEPPAEPEEPTEEPENTEPEAEEPEEQAQEPGHHTEHHTEHKPAPPHKKKSHRR